MSEVSESEAWGSRQPFDLDDEVGQRINELSLQPTIDSLQAEGYGYVIPAADPDFNERLRHVIIEQCRKNGGGGANMLLDKDPVFAEVITNPKLLAVAEVMCGKGFMISQIAASIRPEGAAPIGLHADQNWTPAPFPVHNQLVTFCWATDDYNEHNGSTKIIPKSHLKRRHPTPEEVRDEPGAIPTECPAGSAVVWDGSVWHSNYPRKAPGERVVLHITYSRLALRPVECYDELDDEWLSGQPAVMRTLLGREDFLNTTGGAYAGGIEKLGRTFVWART
ncbi:MAG: phytanoyl-CoA dioxygenase family protein [Pseudomonadota bacterium]|nr:phytanoyl-CoA dioxygenase family protein [Pseudomonadota bacterium]